MLTADLLEQVAAEGNQCYLEHDQNRVDVDRLVEALLTPNRRPLGMTVPSRKLLYQCAASPDCSLRSAARPEAKSPLATLVIPELSHS